MKTKLLVIIILFISQQNFAQWAQVGNDIDGDAAYDYSANSDQLSISGDGSIVAISAPDNDVNGGTSGKVKVFKNVNDTWQQIGGDLNGEAIGDYFGSGIDLSKNGNVLAVGIPGADALVNNSDNGEIKVYINSNDSWVQFGSTINGNGIGGSIGSDIALNANGSIVATCLSNTINIYYFTGVDWNLAHEIHLNGERNFLNGESLEFNDVGDVLIVGNNLYNGDNDGTEDGRVMVFQNISGVWSMKGNSIIGVDEQGYFGSSVTISGDGNMIAFGSPYSEVGGNIEAGFARVYKYESNDWVQVGNDLTGKVESINFGRSVSLNTDGTALAVGSSGRGEFGASRGIAQIYNLENNSWNQISSTIVGEASKDDFGSSIALSDNGAIVAVGGSYNDGGGINSGHVRVYKNDLLTLSTTEHNVEKLVFEIVKRKVVANLENVEIHVFNALGQQIANENLKKGVYILMAKNSEGKIQRSKIIVN
ncbi:hypothetical protein [Wenyingzhuangia sp. 2_MG-2023]|uniref:hypothetical protein n=1 Tax=Wenyingzhuangia sp. 2_MG-2023 TaxID=3062639 RepID=UPI0026E19E66|nr:hypothetical protein [Wenyingzhuangia sp. 2_MG-2023]MDO6737145.1 hypothetical protein [Wenyingzhuangia sp. 2_MG-2023]